TILREEPLIVPDARADARFANNPLVVNDPHITAYAGIPLSGPTRHKVGTLCLADRKARKFRQQDVEVLLGLARLVERELSLSRVIYRQEEQLRLQELLIESQKEKERLFAQLQREKERAETFLLSLMPADIAA